MKKIVLIAFLLCSLAVSAQFTANNISISTSGISEEYESKFKDSANVQALIKSLNQLYLSSSIKSIDINVSYSSGIGIVEAQVKYESVFTGSDKYSAHVRNLRRYGFSKGMSVLFQYQLCTALAEYKMAVARKGGLSFDTDLLDFASSVVLQKVNGDRALFYAYNHMDSRGRYFTYMYTNCLLFIGGKEYETFTQNETALSKNKYFVVGKTIGIDGKKTADYYLCEFFEVDPN